MPYPAQLIAYHVLPQVCRERRDAGLNDMAAQGNLVDLPYRNWERRQPHCQSWTFGRVAQQTSPAWLLS